MSRENNEIERQMDTSKYFDQSLYRHSYSNKKKYEFCRWQKLHYPKQKRVEQKNGGCSSTLDPAIVGSRIEQQKNCNCIFTLCKAIFGSRVERRNAGCSSTLDPVTYWGVGGGGWGGF